MKRWFPILKERGSVHYLQFELVHCLFQRIGEIDRNIKRTNLRKEIRRENKRILGFNSIEVAATRGTCECNIDWHALWVCITWQFILSCLVEHNLHIFDCV